MDSGVGFNFFFYFMEKPSIFLETVFPVLLFELKIIFKAKYTFKWLSSLSLCCVGSLII